MAKVEELERERPESGRLHGRDRPTRATIDASVDGVDMGGRTVAFALVGLVALAGAVIVLTFPSLTAGVATERTETLRTVTKGVAAVLGVIGVYAMYNRGETGSAGQRDQTDTTDGGDLPAAIRAPETAHDAEQPVVGHDFDELLADINGQVDPYNGLEASYAADVRMQLRDTVRRVLVRTTEYTEAEALTAIENGTWTDDRRAASFLGQSSVPAPPLSVQLRDWASGERFDRKVEATTREIRRIQRGGDR